MRWWRRLLAEVPGLAAEVERVARRREVREHAFGVRRGIAAWERSNAERVAFLRDELTNSHRIEVKPPWNGPIGVVPYPPVRAPLFTSSLFVAPRLETERFAIVPMAISRRHANETISIRWWSLCPESDVRAVAWDLDRVDRALRRFVAEESADALASLRLELSAGRERLEATLGKGAWDPRNVVRGPT